MRYNFSEFFQGNNEILLNEFLDKHTSHLNAEDYSVSILSGHYKNILDKFKTSFELEEMLELFENLAKHESSLEYPYIIITNEIYSLKSMLIHNMETTGSKSNIFEFFTLFNKINNRIAQIYLDEYINKLLSVNNIRINSISDLIDRNIIKHYESHLIWLTNLAKYIQEESINKCPELDAIKCEFGIWLRYDAKNIIQNNSKYKAIDSLHNSLHLFGGKIKDNTAKDSYHILITYLEKCELLSLSIGTELALLDNILMNKKITKDALTGAMNRHGLKSVFESQYELSLATNNSFVLAMCDLDYFKRLNDTHGHVAGDKMLKMFVDTVKKYIRNSDVIIRYGGEEFVIILAAIEKDKGYEVLEKIRKKFENSFLTIDEKEVRATVSIGLLEIKPEYYYKQNFLNEYITIADQKLYMAKESGRNQTEVC